MSDDRTRSEEHLPPATREASRRLHEVLRAARELAEAAPPPGSGGGRALIDREIGELRELIRRLSAGTDSLDQQLRSPYRLLVVGPSQAGKSTLINVLAGQRVLATTGVGDARTLKETVLTYSAEGDRLLRVRYIGKQEAQRRRFTLEAYARTLPELNGAFVKPWDSRAPAAAELDEDDVPDLSAEAPSDELAAARGELDRRYRTLVMQIQTLVYPELRDARKYETLTEEDRASLDGATLADWVDGWCMLLGHEPVAGERFGDLWRPRLAGAAELLGQTAEIRESVVGPKQYRDAVEQHTAAGLAFLVDRVELALPSEDLEQMDVEDLPGVGNYQDPAADVARDVLTRAMRERDLDGLLVVAAQNGLDQNTASLVEEAAVLRRVLQGETDLAVAITHVDQIARHRAQDMEDEGVDEDEFPSNDELLRHASEQASVPQEQRLQELLYRQAGDVDEPERSSRVAAVLERTLVVGVEASAAEAHLFKLRQKMSGAFASCYEGTGVPVLIAHFKDRANARHRERLERVRTQTELIRESISAEVARIARDHDVAESVQLEAAAREAYVRVLEASQLPLSNRYTAIRERAASRLQDRVPALLPKTANRAEREARRRKRLVIERCETAGPRGRLIHWATMTAALRWGGTWSGAHHLDLPGDLAEALMPALLSGWRELALEVASTLDDYREATEALLRALEEAAVNAAHESGLTPNAAAIAAARAQLARNIDAAITVLDARLDQLTDLVQPRLRAELKGHFESECARVLREIRRGDGVTRRALRHYDEVGESAIEVGTTAGIGVLERQFSELRTEIHENLFGQDPVSTAFRRLIGGIHDLAEEPEYREARAMLVAWARVHADWDSASRSGG